MYPTAKQFRTSCLFKSTPGAFLGTHYLTQQALELRMLPNRGERRFLLRLCSSFLSLLLCRADSRLYGYGSSRDLRYGSLAFRRREVTARFQQRWLTRSNPLARTDLPFARTLAELGVEVARSGPIYVNDGC